jgi:DNA repair protein SbcC/Rad50
MRLHRLELVAFGPFAERQRVDFDQLSQAGLFLLHGPTGAGKTSVLDAVCFALYGRVPGVRGSVGRLRSDHAAAHVAPEVSCEFSVSGRRFEVTRSPEWQRPKKRGTGTVREQAHVVLRERVGTGWKALTNRVDEAADLLQQLIGLGAEQFTKLILLPQGEFAAFLRATAEERRPLLQKLFGTDRFAEVERWLAERRRESEHQVHLANTTTARLFARAQEARLRLPAVRPADPAAATADPTANDASAEQVSAEQLTPEQVSAEQVSAEQVSAEAAVELVSGWADDARAERAAAHAEVSAAEQAYEQARRASAEAAEALEHQRRQAQLTAELDRLLAGTAQQQQRRAAVTAARHARVLAPLLADLEDAERVLAAARHRWADAQAATLAVGEQPDPGGTAQRLAVLGKELGSLAELLRAEMDLRRLDARQRDGERAIETAERDLAASTAESAELTTRQAQLNEERTAAELIAVSGADREQDANRATAVARAVLELQQLGLAQAEAEDQLRTAIDAHQAAVDAVQELRARRLDGMAAELATGLAGDEPCPVCGSCTHPQPAAHRVPPVTEPAQRRAETAAKAAEAERERARSIVEAGAQRRAALLAVTDGKDAETAAAELAQAQERVLEARAAADRARQLDAKLGSLAARLERAGARQAAATEAAAAGREALAGIAGRRAELRSRLEQARGEDVDVRSRHQRLGRAAEALTECDAAGQACAQAEDRLERAVAGADRAAAAAGFPDRAAAAAALLTEAETERLAELVAEHDARVARLRALLDPADDAAGPDDAGGELLLELDFGDDGQDEVDPELELDRLRSWQAQARQAHEHARERHTLAGHAVRALTGLAAELDAHAQATAPLRQRFAALESVSKCVEGTGGDNTLRMRLSSYVLAARLEQVAAAASVRLAAMSGGRYLLVHTDGPSRSGARSGLGLAVIDGWTGVQRDPSSLSGGETFCTSLALALGLADVVQAEAGGSVIETLLVDEGFGSLDDQTLDEVMDVLDGLRSAGRSVGLVSHVSDLRDRIPAQLEVVKGRHGSRLIA